MRRTLQIGTAVVLGLCLAVVCQAQKKEKPPAFSDPKEAGPDYAIQGEYEGGSRGAQVVALGEGKFDVYLLKGGLPGAGWDGKSREKGTATTTDGKTTVKVAGLDGRIADGNLVLGTKDSVTLKKVERKSKTLGLKPPQGAIVLFDGKNADEWSDGAKVVEGTLMPAGKDIRSKRKFQSYTLHLEFRLAFMPTARGQARANSGVYQQDRWEVQLLDSFGLKGENNECGGIYSQFKPLVNMCLPPLTWQTYDIEFTAAKFEDGKRTAKARATVFHNGVLIHDNVELNGPTGGGRAEDEKPGPVFLQGHGGQVQYRNIWVAEKK